MEEHLAGEKPFPATIISSDNLRHFDREKDSWPDLEGGRSMAAGQVRIAHQMAAPFEHEEDSRVEGQPGPLSTTGHT